MASSRSPCYKQLQGKLDKEALAKSITYLMSKVEAFSVTGKLCNISTHAETCSQYLGNSYASIVSYIAQQNVREM